jgi:hypothetical protein
MVSVGLAAGIWSFTVVGTVDVAGVGAEETLHLVIDRRHDLRVGEVEQRTGKRMRRPR